MEGVEWLVEMGRREEVMMIMIDHEKGTLGMERERDFDICRDA